jgi:hypothetical protein
MTRRSVQTLAREYVEIVKADKALLKAERELKEAKKELRARAQLALTERRTQCLTTT